MTPDIQWLTAFPQIVSRICHPNDNAVKALVVIMTKVLQEYPQQALWLMTGVISSARPARRLAAERVLKYAASNASVRDFSLDRSDLNSLPRGHSM